MITSTHLENIYIDTSTTSIKTGIIPTVPVVIHIQGEFIVSHREENKHYILIILTSLHARKPVSDG